MQKKEMLKKILEEDDYIRCPKVGNSLQKFLQRNSDGVSDAMISRLLLMPEEEIEKLYQEAVAILKREMNVN